MIIIKLNGIVEKETIVIIRKQILPTSKSSENFCNNFVDLNPSHNILFLTRNSNLVFR